MTSTRLESQLAFVLEIDKLKRILRQTPITGPERRQENDAEHSWHLALMAPLLAEYSPEPVDLLRVVRMVLVHDLVEIDAGDTFAYDAAGYADKEERERKAAQRIFGLLPEDQRAAIWSLWEEFEAMATAESRFANALDRVQPLLLNYHTGGGSWAKHRVTRAQVFKRMEPVKHGAPALWPVIERIVEDAYRKGWLPE